MLKYLSRYKLFWGALGSGTISTIAYHYKNTNEQTNTKININSLNRYSQEIVESHNKLNDFWVTYHNKVYDISKFVHGHPGGIDKIKLAAGGPLEPYWDIYRQHNNNQVKKILEQYYIGELIDPDTSEEIEHKTDNLSPYSKDPNRHKILNIHSHQPFNGETPLPILREHYITPCHLWYIRNHHPTPDINGETHNLTLEGFNLDTKISLDELKNDFLRAKITTTIQCAGNRRSEYNKIRKVHGSEWQGGALGTACWEGVYLRDILKKHGFDETRYKGKYFTIWGDDIDFRISVRVSQVMDPKCQVLVADTMNGKPLPRDHGYPLRLIVPGSVGTKQVKWLTNIELSDTPCDSSWQSGVAYKMLPQNITAFNMVTPEMLTAIPTVDVLPVQSLICDIVTDVKKDEVILKGVAWSGGGNNIIKVEISTDDGKKWIDAKLKEGTEQPISQAWAWTFWELRLPSNTIKQGDTIICKATDYHYHTQPESVDSIWNLRGILNNSWHRVKY